MVAPALRRRAFFSAGVESADWLQRIRDMLAARMRLEKERLANGATVWRDRDSFIDDARKLANAAGLPIAPDGLIGTLQDIRSLPRLDLIYNIQNQQAAEFSRLKADLDPVALDMYPAFELSRVESRRVIRGEGFWSQRWRTAGTMVGWRGASKSGRHIALKTSPIWQALGDIGPFGNPYPPFEWGSGMGTIDIARREAEASGLIAPGQKLSPTALPDFNAGLEAQAQVSPEIASRMRTWFGDQVKVADGKASWTGAVYTPPPSGDLNAANISNAKPITFDAPHGISRLDELSVTTRRDILQAEESIAYLPVEHALAFDDYGKIIGRVVGGPQSVDMPDVGARDRRVGLIAHNHPDGSPPSIKDFSTAIFKSIGELHTIVPRGTFVLGVPDVRDRVMQQRNLALAWHRLVQPLIDRGADYGRIHEAIKQLARENNVRYALLKRGAL